MSSRGWLLLGTFLMAGCGRGGCSRLDDAWSAVVPRPRNRSDLVLRCAHVVVAPDLIRGVLTAQNIGKTPLSVVDHGNSFGAYQWSLTSRTWTAETPEYTWRSNCYTETVLAPGEVRHARFTIQGSKRSQPSLQNHWEFWSADFLGPDPLSSSGERMEPPPPFAPGQSIRLIMDGSRADTHTSDPKIRNPLWVGLAVVRSQEVASVEELEARLGGTGLQ
jgi:hypothetical protein